MSNPDKSGSANRSDKTADFETLCRKAGLKVTPQRLAVHKALIESKDHPSADMLYRRIKNVIPNISFDTVNRTLLTLAEIGAALVVEGTGDVKRFDGTLRKHQHFRCVKCKRIFDIDHTDFDDIPVPREIGTKFTVTRTTVYFEGFCDACMMVPHK